MATRSRNLLLLSLVANTAHGFTEYYPNCTRPNQMYSYVAAPQGRGTLDILFACSFTILACTWSILHLPVPRQKPDEESGNWVSFKWGLEVYWNKAFWMILTMLAPEIIISLAAGDFAHAWKERDRMQEFCGPKWTLRHSFFVDMGGFIIKGIPRDAQSSEPIAHPERSQSVLPFASYTQYTFGEAISREETPDWRRPGGMTRLRKALEPRSTPPYNAFHLSHSQLRMLQDEGYIERVPVYEDHEIEGRAKSDSLVKAMAILAITRTIAEGICRAFQNLAVTQLEVGTIAFSVCAVLTYVILWKKPKDVELAITVLDFRDIGKMEKRDKLIADLKREEELQKGLFGKNRTRQFPGAPFPASWHWTHDSKEGPILMWASIAGYGVGFAFGAWHMMSWKFSFPSLYEQKLWQVSSGFITVVPVITALYIYLRAYLSVLLTKPGFTTDDAERSRLPKTLNVLVEFLQKSLLTPWLGYLAARLFILVEMFRTLWFLPEGAYVSTNMMNFPGFH